MQADVEAKIYAQSEDVRQQIEQALMQLEQRVIKYIETRQIRVTVKEALNQLVVVGNCLLFLPPAEGGAKLYRLSSYVLQRDALGNVLQIVATDKLSFATLPADVQQMLSADGKEWKPEEPIVIYTHVYSEGNEFKSYQEVENMLIPGTEQSYPKDKCPWIALRMVKVDGESYGRSFVEEYLGDLVALDGLSEALKNAASISAFILYLVNPAGTTQPRKIAKAKSGDFVPGRAEDIQCLQLDKSVDLQTTKAMADVLEQRLSYVFMLNSAVQRQAERVTAEEIRYVATELEDTLGGTYSILSQELQLPLVRRLLTQLETMGEIPQLPDGAVEPAITTGLEALGRGHDLNKLQMFSELLANPEIAQRVNMGNFALMYATSLGLDTTGLIKSDEQLAQEQQQQMMMQMAQSAAPQMAKGAMEQTEQ